MKHTYTTNYEEVLVTTKSTSWDVKLDFQCQVQRQGEHKFSACRLRCYEWVKNHTNKFSVTYAGNVQFDITASFDGSYRKRHANALRR